MAKRILVIYLMISAISLLSCIDEISFEPPNEFQNSIVIQGKIVKGNPSSVELTLQNVFDFSFEEGPSFFDALEVLVVNDKEQKLLVPKLSTGSYKLKIDPSSGFEVSYGGSYGVEVKLLDGRSYRSELEVLHPVPKMESVEHKLVSRENVNDEGELVSESWIEYRISTPLIAQHNQERTNIRWNLERTYKQSDLIAQDQCYVTDSPDPDRIQFVAVKDNSSTEISDELILEEVVSRIMVEGQYISVIQESLAEGALSFWTQAQEISTNSGTFYEPPVGQIVTNFNKTDNFEGEVFGYFYATEHDSIHVFVDSTFIDFYTAICPHPDNVPREDMDFGPCDDCCFCLWLDNSTTEKPYFWVD